MYHAAPNLIIPDFFLFDNVFTYNSIVILQFTSKSIFVYVIYDIFLIILCYLPPFIDKSGRILGSQMIAGYIGGRGHNGKHSRFL